MYLLYRSNNFWKAPWKPSCVSVSMTSSQPLSFPQFSHNIHYVIAIHLMRWLTYFYDFSEFSRVCNNFKVLYKKVWKLSVAVNRTGRSFLPLRRVRWCAFFIVAGTLCNVTNMSRQANYLVFQRKKWILKFPFSGFEMLPIQSYLHLWFDPSIWPHLKLWHCFGYTISVRSI